MSQDALGLLKHLKTARARWPFPDAGEGRAGGWDVRYQPTSLRRGEGGKEAGRALAS